MPISRVPWAALVDDDGSNTVGTLITKALIASVLLDPIDVALAAVGGAPLASPTFTGVPAGPTAAAGTNTTQLATTAYVLAALGLQIRQVVTAIAGGDFTTTSATLVDLTNMAITLTTGAAAKVLVLATLPCSVASGYALFDWKLDGVDGGGIVGTVSSVSPTTVTLFRLYSGLSAASHTIQMRVRHSGGGVSIAASMSSVMNGNLIAMELR
ncbi:MAG: hypothetical protein ABJA98_01755 [Acidobacteriota bacterium]